LKISTFWIAVSSRTSTPRQLPSAKTEHQREQCENKSDWLDQEIDRLVYALYGLTDAEIKLVENRA
jgi:hypothetical protein